MVEARIDLFLILFASCGIAALSVALVISRRQNKRSMDQTFQLKELNFQLEESMDRYQVFIARSLAGIYCYKVDPPMSVDLPAEQQVDWLIDNSRVEECNSETIRIYEMPSIEKVIGLGFEDLEGKSEEALRRIVRTFIANEYKLDSTEQLIVTRNKNEKWILVSTLSVIENKKLTRIWGTMIDISQQKTSQRDLKIALDDIVKLNERIKAENTFLREELQATHLYENIVGRSQAMKSVLAKAEMVAKTNSSVLILGETGTGKEVVARTIHDISFYKSDPLVIVNCASIPHALIESELFGREKGAYTGAVSKQIGRFELADNGTIFLDEIGELPLELQAKLLRVLQEGTFERLGSNKTISVSVRVIAATNRNLADMVKKGSFREDLYYRLNVFPIEIPPLRERTEDIEALVWAFVKEFSAVMRKHVTKIRKASMDALLTYPWPGNVRELRNTVERAMISCSGQTLCIQTPTISEAPRQNGLSLDEVQKRHILSVLEMTQWRIRGESGAAAILDVKPTTLETRMAKLDIRRPGN